MDTWFSEKALVFGCFRFLYQKAPGEGAVKIFGVDPLLLSRLRCTGTEVGEEVEHELRKLGRKRPPAISQELINKDLPRLVHSPRLQSGGKAEGHSAVGSLGPT